MLYNTQNETKTTPQFYLTPKYFQQLVQSRFEKETKMKRFRQKSEQIFSQHIILVRMS